MAAVDGRTLKIISYNMHGFNQGYPATGIDDLCKTDQQQLKGSRRTLAYSG